ncbi:hypothetical protein RSOLAG1IB_11617 [Rhizoctonia solani AG-1 IB]|uniref:G domain-containing protein n=1 Tax=Thanatephorus cucumeris (strain AG1-IB / isolate 7/3/14) TaxID=1108050 RepID=A0A0B7FBB1_THACB|nr:hypothetical protein RSOLAG1IB_11617 [Rhizoctonia solani AG-1 IB]
MFDIDSSRETPTATENEEFNISSSESSSSTPKPRGDGVEVKEAVASREALIEEPKPQVPRSVRILIVGPSGSGKTWTIKNYCRSTKEPLGDMPYVATKSTKVTKLHIGGQPFELIDTPGFDGISLTDAETFADIANYLSNTKPTQTGISGIIYVHRAGNAVHSRSLQQNFRVLNNIFLGDIGITRLGFLVTQINDQDIQTDYGKLLTSHGSVFNTVFSAGAGTVVATYPNQIGFEQLLKYYGSKMPVLLPVQLDESCKSHSTFLDRVGKELGYYDYHVAQSLLDDRERYLRELYEQQLANQRDSEIQLRQELQKSRLEYSSLRSQLQLQENVEQSEVVQALKDLNRMIDDFGRSVSAHLTDNYVQKLLGRDPSRATTLHSRDTSTLKALFHHRDGQSSLVACSTGKGINIEAFLDYSIRHFLCRFLTIGIFQPFHPEIDSSLDNVLSTSYANIRERESQAIAGKWRSETFKSLDQSNSKGLVEGEINRHLSNFLRHRLRQLIKGVFGRDIPLPDIYITNLRALIKMAWDWNSDLKSGVIMLGDFVQTSFSRSRFNPRFMEEFEAVSEDHIPETALGTLALGLICQKAVGGGNPIDKIVVCKAVVATKSIFD